MEELFRFAPHVHLFHGAEISVLFSATNFDVIYVDNEIGRILESLSQVISQENFLKQVDKSKKIEARILFNQLILMGLIWPLSTSYESSSLLSNQNASFSQSIRILDIIPTFTCNISCTYCYQRSATSAKKYWHNRYLDVELGKEIVTTFLNQERSLDGQSLKPMELVFIGGEPLAHPDLLYQLIPLARAHPNGGKGDLTIVVVTNAILADAALAGLFYKNDVFIIVSMDGAKESHNKARSYLDGSESYSKMISGYRLFQEVGCNLGISVAVGNHNIGTFVRDVKEMLTSLHPQDLSINSCLHDDLDKPNPNRIPSELFAKTIKILYTELSQVGRIPSQLLRRFEPLLTRTPNHYFCPAFSEKMVVAPDGTSGPCEGFAYSREYIYDWKNFFFNTVDKRDEWLKSSPLQNEDCCQCPLIFTCGGGCRYDAKIIYGSIKQLDEYRCIQEKELLIWFLTEFLPDYCQINIREKNMFIINDEMRNDIHNKLKGLDINIAWR